jgi:hypothetical protein
MPNVLSVYNPIFYAQEALIVLYKALGMAGRVHRGYDKNPQQKGSLISISRPSTFTAQDAPSTAQDINASEVQISLNYWREVKFKLTDKELTFTTEKIIEDHIRPAAYALADDIDQKLCALYKDVPWYQAATSPGAVADITAMQRIMFNNNVPEDEGARHLMLSGVLREEYLNLAAFSQHQGSGDVGVAAQMRGSLGVRYGFETFANQNVRTHTTGVSADATGALTADHAAGATTIAFDGVTAAGTFKAGDTFVIAGNTQRYAFTADATADGTGIVTATAITPPLVQAYLENAVITVTLLGGVQSMAFHRNAFALAMAPLTEIGNQLGARIATVVDPITNLALRSRLFYDGDSSTVFVALDALYGIKTLDPNLACRLVD